MARLEGKNLTNNMLQKLNESRKPWEYITVFVDTMANIIKFEIHTNPIIYVTWGLAQVLFAACIVVVIVYSGKAPELIETGLAFLKKQPDVMVKFLSVFDFKSINYSDYNAVLIIYLLHSKAFSHIVAKAAFKAIPQIPGVLVLDDLPM